MTNVPFDTPVNHTCGWCNNTQDTPTNPLVELAGGGDEVEYIHLQCARLDSRFGFCWCCDWRKVFYVEDLNDANECADHAGESVPDYPKGDADSYVEYVQNHDS